MAGLGMNLQALRRYRKQWERLSADISARDDGRSSSRTARLTETARFGSNPGALRMKSYVPGAAPKGAPLVVVLHGCRQDAEGYDHGSGWSRLADAANFVVLYPEQQQSNNPNNCFSWFVREDNRRGAGEALSIRQMIDVMITRHKVDPDRVFIAGLSAGGAMTSVMLASYPEVFAGGAIIAGLPYGVADSVQQAFEAMFNGSKQSARQLGDKVRGASTHGDRWPRVSVWHGSADTTVVPVNATEVVKQWLDVHDLVSAPSTTQETGHRRRQWRRDDGETLVEEIIIEGMAHGTPLDVGAGAEVAGPFLLDAGVSSTWHIANFWGLVGAKASSQPLTTGPAPSHHEPERPHEDDQIGVQGIITAALKKAGILN